MKSKELNNKSDNDLLKLKRELEFNLTKAHSEWGAETVKNKEARIISKKGMTQKGTRTSLRKQIRKAIRQINTELTRKGLYEKKYKSKRRERRLRGRMK